MEWRIEYTGSNDNLARTPDRLVLSVGSRHEWYFSLYDSSWEASSGIPLIMHDKQAQEEACRCLGIYKFRIGLSPNDRPRMYNGENSALEHINLIVFKKQNAKTQQ